MVGGSHFEEAEDPAVGAGTVVPHHHGAASSTKECGSVGVGQRQDTAQHGRIPGEGIGSGKDLGSRTGLGESSTTREHAGVGGAVVIGTYREGVRPQRVVPAPLECSEVVGIRSGESEGERAGVGDIEIKLRTGQGIGIGEDERAGRDAGGSREAVASGEEHRAEATLGHPRGTAISVVDQGGRDNQVGIGITGDIGDREGRSRRAQLDAVVGIDRGGGADHRGIGPGDAHVVEQIRLPGAIGSAICDELATIEDEVVEIVEDPSVLDDTAVVHREDSRREVGGITEHVGVVEVECAAAIHRDGGTAGSHAVLGITKDKSARIHEGRSGERVGPREGQGRVASLGEGARSGEHSAQGLVGRVAEDE